MNEDLPSWGANYADRPSPPPLPSELEAELIKHGNRPRDFGLLNLTPIPDESKHKRIPPELYFYDGSISGDQKHDGVAELAEVFARILDWLNDTGLKPTDKRYLKAVALRACAMTWTIDPARMNGDSLRCFAGKLGGRGTCTQLSNLTADFSRQFSIRNRFKVHDSKPTKKILTQPNPLHDASQN